MNGLMYFAIMYATDKNGNPLSKEQVMEDQSFWSMGYRGVEHWGFHLEILFNKYYA